VINAVLLTRSEVSIQAVLLARSAVLHVGEEAPAGHYRQAGRHQNRH